MANLDPLNDLLPVFSKSLNAIAEMPPGVLFKRALKAGTNITLTPQLDGSLEIDATANAGTQWYSGTAVGSTVAFSAQVQAAFTAYVEGTSFLLTFSLANDVNAVLAINGLSSLPLKTRNYHNVVGGEIQPTLLYWIVYTNGQLVIMNPSTVTGSAGSAGTSIFPKTTIITQSEIFTPTPGASSARFQGVGGGGAGGFNNSSITVGGSVFLAVTGAGGGGGAGGYFEFTTTYTTGEQFTVNIGAGGIGGTVNTPAPGNYIQTGNSGGDTIIVGCATAHGGAGGISQVAGSTLSGPGGAGGTATCAVPGGTATTGTAGLSASTTSGGAGAASPLGSGGAPGVSASGLPSTAPSADGSAGTYGGGGGGCYVPQLTPALHGAGGNGGNGVVIVTEYA